MNNPRESALKILFKIEYEGAYSNLALKDGLANLCSADKALATRLVYGCVSMKITLDYIISLYSTTKLSKLSKSVALILRMGIYQIIFMDKIPESAAVNESVKLATKYEYKSKGFVNAVLRRVCAEKDSIEYPKDEIDNLRTKYSFPKKLCEEFVQKFGYDFAKDLIKSLIEEPKTVIRTNSLKTDRDSLLKKLEGSGACASSLDCLPHSITISGASVGELSEFKEGLFTVQDTAAQLACLVLGAKPGDNVMDMCAAPGGKTTYLAELMQNQGNILAFDVHPHKVDLIDNAASRLGIDIIRACTFDSTLYKNSFDCTQDKILADVPCSGLGIIRRKPEIKWKREDKSELSKIQYNILENAIRYLAPGGELVYSTCTILPEENEDIIRRALDEYSFMEPVDITDALPPAFKKPGAKDGYITLYPHTDFTDGFFICKLRKKK